MDLEQCKQILKARGIHCENISEETIRFICGSFSSPNLGPAPDIQSIDPAERVKAGMQKLDQVLADKNADTKGFILDLISDAIEMSAGNTGAGDA